MGERLGQRVRERVGSVIGGITTFGCRAPSALKERESSCIRRTGVWVGVLSKIERLFE